MDKQWLPGLVMGHTPKAQPSTHRLWSLGTPSPPHGQGSLGKLPGKWSTQGDMSLTWLSHAPPALTGYQKTLDTP